MCTQILQTRYKRRLSTSFTKKCFSIIKATRKKLGRKVKITQKRSKSFRREVKVSGRDIPLLICTTLPLSDTGGKIGGKTRDRLSMTGGRMSLNKWPYKRKCEIEIENISMILREKTFAL